VTCTTNRSSRFRILTENVRKRSAKMRSLFSNATPLQGFPAIASLPWVADPSSGRRGAYELLGKESHIKSKLAAWLNDLDSSQIDFIVEHSAERATHYKWLLGGSRHSYLVWLHEYKPSGQFAKAESFAASVHDHRLWFCSRVVSGALHVTWYTAHISGETASLAVTRRCRLSSNMVEQMAPMEIHGIDRVEDNTFTLLIQGPAERRYSTVYDLSDGSMSRKYDLDALYSRLSATLGAASL
jgi:hypothetical protein